MLVKAAGVSMRSEQRILEVNKLAPHRIRTFKLSNDPKFAENLKDEGQLASSAAALTFRHFARASGQHCWARGD